MSKKKQKHANKNRQRRKPAKTLSLKEGRAQKRWRNISRSTQLIAERIRIHCQNQRWRWLWTHIAAVEKTPRFVQQLWWRLKENYSYKPYYKDYRTYFDFLTRFSLWLFLKPRSSNFLCKFSSANRRAIYKFDLNILILFLFLFKFKYLRWQISV